MSNSASLPLDQDNEQNHENEVAATPPEQQEVRWEVVAEERGLLPARIIADRLQSEGIPARAWQESVGQAYGMTVGPLGTGFVSVPEEYVERAQEILAESAEMPVDDDEVWDEEDPEQPE
jgi:hypothetical protein